MEARMLALSRVSKAYGPTKALTDVTLSLSAGHVHAILGENGAGKSTLVKILNGVVSADTGTIQLDGRDVSYSGLQGARSVGISTAFQELSMLPNLTVAENLLMPTLPRGAAGLVSKRKSHSKTAAILDKWELSLAPGALVGDLPLATKQRLELVRAFSQEPRVLILDEPTAALSDTEWLFRHIRAFINEQRTVVYISHRMPEIEEICDKGFVLRNGRVVDEFDRDRFDENRLISQMIGRSLDSTFPPRASAARETSALSVRGFSVGNALTDVDLTVAHGEIVGVAALDGQGQRELFYALFGAMKRTAGEVSVDGKTARAGSPRAALRSGDGGMVLVPEERKTEALFLQLPSDRNMTVPVLPKVALAGLIRPRVERARAAAAAREVDLSDGALAKSAGSLSGGNQQKVVLGKALQTSARMFLLFDPTRGIDAGTKHEVYALIGRLAEEGRGVLLHSTELPELVGLCDRVYTLYGGRVNGEFAGDQLTEHALLSAIVGQSGHPSADIATGETRTDEARTDETATDEASTAASSSGAHRDGAVTP
jgi:ribose transport system ATP-binding protein